jgi:hypothetical protein
MNMNSRKMISFGKYPLILLMLSAMALPVMPGLNSSARASDAGAFVGGMVAGHLIHGFVERDQVRTEAEVEQAQNSRDQQAAPAPAPQQQTAEQRMQQLDKMAAGGYITPEEYKAKKKAIMDSM